MSELPGQIALLLENVRPGLLLEQALRMLLTPFHSETGTIHLLDGRKQWLHLVAQVGLPPQMLDLVRTIPPGKGIAGQTVVRREPVTMCNLQTDGSGIAKPGARQSGVGGALCVTLWKDHEIVGTIGIGTMRVYEYTAEETGILEEVGRIIAARMNA